jgi:hypothetical protein
MSAALLLVHQHKNCTTLQKDTPHSSNNLTHSFATVLLAVSFICHCITGSIIHLPLYYWQVHMQIWLALPVLSPSCHRRSQHKSADLASMLLICSQAYKTVTDIIYKYPPTPCSLRPQMLPLQPLVSLTVGVRQVTSLTVV